MARCGRRLQFQQRGDGVGGGTGRASASLRQGCRRVGLRSCGRRRGGGTGPLVSGAICEHRLASQSLFTRTLPFVLLDKPPREAGSDHPGADEEQDGPGRRCSGGPPGLPGRGRGWLYSLARHLRANFHVECVQVSMNLTKQLTTKVLKKGGHL